MQLSLFHETFEPDADALARCLRADVIAVDVETETRWNGSGPKADFGLSYPADVTVLALAWLEAGTMQSTVLAAPFDEQARTIIRALIARPACFVAHNAVFDFRQISTLTNGRVPELIWDTQSMARLIHPAVDASYSLVSVAAALRIPVPERQQAMKSQRGKLHTLPLALTLEYAQDDAKLALAIYQQQRAMPFDAELIDWECRAMREYCRMTAEGIRLNVPFVEQRLAELGAQRDVLAARLRDDGLYTPGSSQARAKYLYETKRIPLPQWGEESHFFTRAGRRRLRENPGAPVQLSDLSTRSDVVESYVEDGSPYADRLRDLSAYMEIDWLLSTLKGLVDHAARDGRLHSLVTTATESGRRASSYPHMQNWKMPAMAGVACGDEGFTLVEIDYSNAENVMAAYIAADDALAAACAAKDFHAVMAGRYFGAAWDEVRDDPTERKHLRTMAKKITYGTAYGMGADRLGRSIGVSTGEAQRIMRAKDAAFANVTRARAAAQRQAPGILHLWTGRPVAVPSAFVAWNYLCQGGVSEVLKRAIVRVSEAYRARGLRSRVALDMHDALILEVAHDEWDDALTLASSIMTTITPDNGRTDPPIRWRAEPNADENQRKWGARQWHPAT